MKLSRRPLWPLALSSAIAACIAVAATVFVLSREAQPAPLLATKDLKYVALASTDPNATPHGRIFWDADHHVWHVYVFDLTPPPAGQVYEVWFIDKARGPLPAGTFEVNGIGNGQLILNVPKGMDVTAAAISNEPAGGTEKPTGKVWLQGKIE